MIVDIGDVELFFDVDGAKLVPQGPYMSERPTLLLLHTGPGADHSFYKEHVGPELARDMQVLYLDHRGAGRSGRSTPERWTLDTWAEDVRRFCDALEIERPVVLGTAFGAFVAVRYAARHPDGLAKLVLTSAVARYSHTRSITAFDRLGGPAAGEVAARYFADPNEVNLAEFIRVCLPLYSKNALPPESLARIEINFELSSHWDGGEARTFDLREELGRIGVPTLVLAGDDDPSTTIEGTEELVAAMPPELVRFVRYPEARHGVFRDAPEAIDVVRRFVLEEA